LSAKSGCVERNYYAQDVEKKGNADRIILIKTMNSMSNSFVSSLLSTCRHLPSRI